MKFLYNFNSSIKNAYNRNKNFFICQNSKILLRIVRILYKEGFINGFSIDSRDPKKLVIFLKYIEGKPTFRDISYISNSGRRIYVKSKIFKKTLLKEGFFFISSSKYGIFLTTQQNMFSKVISGEVIAKLNI